MPSRTLEKLSQNPHYKMSAKQRAQLEEDQTIEYGAVPKNSNGFAIHQTHIRKIPRTSKPQEEEENE